MAATTKTRAPRDASAIAAKTVETTVDALSHVDMRGGASIDTVTLTLNELAARGFSDALNRVEVSAIAHLAIAQTDKLVAKSFYMRGGVGGELVLASHPEAIAAAKKDNPGWSPVFAGGVLTNRPTIGEHVRAYGHHVCENGSRKGTENVKTGQFVRDELQHAAFERVRTRWNALIKPEATEAERAAAASKRAEKKLAKQREAALQSADAIRKGDGALIKPDTSQDLVRTVLSVLVDLRKFATDHTDLCPVVLGTALNKIARETEELFDKHYRDADGIK